MNTTGTCKTSESKWPGGRYLQLTLREYDNLAVQRSRRQVHLVLTSWDRTASRHILIDIIPGFLPVVAGEECHIEIPLGLGVLQSEVDALGVLTGLENEGEGINVIVQEQCIV